MAIYRFRKELGGKVEVRQIMKTFNYGCTRDVNGGEAFFSSRDVKMLDAPLVQIT